MTIRVMDTKGGRVRLAIDAPPEVKVLRSELDAWEKPAKEGAA